MKKNLTLLLALLLVNALWGQSARQVVIEHFTNSRCGICASKNPAFFQTLASYPQVIHIAYYPSAPYQNCFFSMQNKAENDARTNYYGAYGSTPQAVLNGKKLPIATPTINATTLDTAINQTSPVEVQATETWVTADSIAVRVVVRTTATAPVNNARLFAGIVEEPVLYNAPNGENVHHNVFRGALTNVTGDLFALPPVGDSIVFSYAYKVKSGWNAYQLHTLAMVQRDDTKEVLNADNSERGGAPVGVDDLAKGGIGLYPNPFTNHITVTGALGKTVELYNLTGQLLLTEQATGEQHRINSSALMPGVYVIKVDGYMHKAVKQ